MEPQGGCARPTQIGSPLLPSRPRPSSQLRSAAAVPRSELLEFEARRALGGLIELVDDSRVRDILIHVRDGAAQLWVDSDGTARRIPGWSLPPAAARRLAVRLVAAGGRQLDELHPCADAHIGGGVRVHAVLPPASASGTAISMRLPAAAPPVFSELVAAGLCTPEIAEALEAAVRSRRNLLITGGTGAGKTTLLAALLGLVPAHERILSIEDLAELRVDHAHHLALEARPPNAEGIGEIGVDRLLREALRMRPDRMVLGECRGAEIVTLLTALNTGHDGGAGTLHANRLADVPARLEALGMLAGLPAAALARQAVSALHLVVHLARDDSGNPRIVHLGRLRLENERLVAVPR